MYKLVSTVFYIGKLPRFQASVASLMGYSLFTVLITLFSITPPVILIYAGFTLTGFYAVYHYLKITGSDDPKEVVMDEFLAASLIPFFITNIYFGFFSLLLFRVVDIKKPWVIQKAENIKHWTSIFIDDYAAVLIAIAGVKILEYLAELL